VEKFDTNMIIDEYEDIQGRAIFINSDYGLILSIWMTEFSRIDIVAHESYCKIFSR